MLTVRLYGCRLRSTRSFLFPLRLTLRLSPSDDFHLRDSLEVLRLVGIKKLLERIELGISINELASQVMSNFEVGSLISIDPLLVGYEEVNCLLSTSTGKYIIKIFSKDKDLTSIYSNVASLLEYYKGNIPVPKLYSYKNEKYLYKVMRELNTYLVVMDYFDGEKFTDIDPTLKDKKSITKLLSKIHNLNFQTTTIYDSWLTIHLEKEFKLKHAYLSKENYNFIKPIIMEFKNIYYEKLTKSIVHFDLHRENVMKNMNGDYCILDLATTDYNYKIFDLATFMALFCTDSNKPLKDNLNMYKSIIQEYLKIGKLNVYEKELLLLLIKATFASNTLIPQYLQKSGTDENPEQTIYYKSMGEAGLHMLKGIDRI